MPPVRSSSRPAALAVASVLAALAVPPAGSAQNSGTLRVCADPNNLPFSNQAEAGFENRIARLLAEELGVELTYVWAPQYRGFFRKTLSAGLCDLVMGVPSRFDRALPTTPYYRSTYVFVSRTDEPAIASLDDPRLRHLKIGVHLIGDDYANTPPAHALGNRGMANNIVGFPIYGDYSRPNPPARLIEAVASGRVDVAVVWGPFAGYFAPRQPVPLRITPVTPAVDPPDLPFTFEISLGVRQGNQRLRDRLDQALRQRRTEIRRILDRFGVPRPAGAVGLR